MELAPALFFAKVMHKRLFPRVNAFHYDIYYLACPLSRLAELADGWRFGVEHSGCMSFYAKDHGPRTGEALEPWIRSTLLDAGITQAAGEIVLVTMPRVMGYGFNPVSFWLCLDKERQLRAVLCEVHNTFNEQHSYICVHDDRRPITGDDWLGADKQFHVSPFIEREGSYRFRFDYRPDSGKLGVWIDYYNAQTQKQLITSLIGNLFPYTSSERRRAFWSYPLMTLKVIGLIHWQAVKLVAKHIRYVGKPLQTLPNISSGGNLTKNLGNGQLSARNEGLYSPHDHMKDD